MRKNICIITHGYPYGLSENTFVEPEIKKLSQYFNITIVAVFELLTNTEEKYRRELPGNVRLLTYCTEYGKKLFRDLPSYPFHRCNLSDCKEVWKSGEKRIMRARKSMWAYTASMDFYRFLKKNGIFDDIDNTIYYSYWMEYFVLSLLLEKHKHPNMRIVARAHGTDLYHERAEHGRQPFHEVYGKECDYLVFACKAGKDYFSRRIIPAQRPSQYKVMRLGCYEPKRFPKAKSNDGWFNLLSCSHIIPLKRVELIAEALNLLPDCKIKWSHFGDGEDQQKIAELISHYKLNAHLRGFVSNEDLMKIYETEYFDAFITTSSTEGGCPVSISEALAYGVPIIGTSVGGVPEQIDGNGILLSADSSVRDVADAIRRVYEMPIRKRGKMRKQSRSIYEEKFNLEKNIEELINFFSIL